MSDIDGAVFPNQRDGYHKILSDQGKHDEPASASTCYCSKAPLRKTLSAITETMVSDRTKNESRTDLISRTMDKLIDLAVAYKKSGRQSYSSIKCDALVIAALATRIYEEL